MTFHIIAVEESDSTLGVYDGTSLLEVTRIETGTWPHEIALDAAGTTAYVTNFGIKDYDEHIGQPGASISVIDLKLFAERERLYTFTDGKDYRRRRAPHSVVIDQTREQLLVNVEAEDTLLRFTLDGTLSASANRPAAFVAYTTDGTGSPGATPLPKGTHTMVLDPGGTHLYLGCGPAGLVEVDAATGGVLRTLHCGGPVRGIEWSHDGKQLLVAAGGDLCLVDPQTMLVTRRYPTGVAQLLYPTPTPDGAYVLVPAVWEGMVLRIALVSGKVERMITGSDPIHIVIPEGGYAAFVGHGRSKWIVRFDWRNFTQTGRIITRGGANGLAWAPARPVPEREVLTVGAVIPLTGPGFREGQDLRLGYEYWVERINGAGGLVAGEKVYTVELLIRDSRSLAGTAGEAPTVGGENTAEYLKRQARELVAAGAVALFGSYPSPPHFALRDAADALDVPLITASGAAPQIYAAGSRNVFGIMSTADGFLNETFDLLARQDDPPRSAMFIACEDPAATRDAQSTARHASEKLGIAILGPGGAEVPVEQRVMSVAHNGEDFDRQLELVALFEPDVVAMTGHLGEAIAFTRALAANGIKPKAIVYSVGPAMPAFVQALGPLAANTMGSAMWSPALQAWGHDRFITPRNFRDTFFDRFSKEPSYLAAGASACGTVFEEAVRRAGSAEANDVLALLRDGFSMLTFYSPIELDATGLNSSRRLLTIQLQETPRGLEHAALWPPVLAGRTPADAVWPFPGWPSDDATHSGH